MRCFPISRFPDNINFRDPNGLFNRLSLSNRRPFIPTAYAFAVKRYFARVPRCGRFPPTRLRRSRIGASQGCINVRQCVKSTPVCKQPPFSLPIHCCSAKYLKTRTFHYLQ